RAYMSEGRAISDHDELARLAAEIGLDAGEVRAILDTDRYEEDVRTDQELARQIGIRGVPFFVFDGRYAVSGAQPSDVFREVLRRIEAEWDEEARDEEASEEEGDPARP